MNKNIFKIAFGMVVGASMVFTSCTKEPDEADLYTFTGQTIQDYLEEHDDIFHQFNVIMKRSGYDRMMDSYGQYTCLAPVNEGVLQYVDSLYNDPKAKIPHNGMSENSVNGLTDDQCKEIALYHLTNALNMYAEQLSVGVEGGREIFTMLNVPFTTQLNSDGVVRLNGTAKIIDFDKEMTNGYVHHLDRIIPRNTEDIGSFFENLPEYSIFFEAMEKTGLLDTLAVTKKNATYKLDNVTGRPGSSWQSTQFYCPEECKIGFTIFAETDKVLKDKAGITDFASLKQFCVNTYQNAQQWYDYPGMESTPISVANDYTNPYNVVNMFIRYHILKAAMPVSKLVYVRDTQNDNWNYAFGGEPYDYYETMLPHTIMKIWQPLYHNSGASTNMWINRWRANNTLTDEIGTYGSEAMHTLERKGCRIISADANKKAYNGYVHSIDDILVYDEGVVKGVLHERLRIDAGTMFYELINNNIRFASGSDIAGFNKSGNDGSMTRLPLDYFDNLVDYSGGKTKLSWYTTGAWRAWEADQLSGWDENDFAFRLPPVPAGDYEIRIIYPPMSNSGLQQYYIGTSSNPSSMIPLGLPIDARYPNTDIEADRQATGYMKAEEFDDYGVASDLVMRNHGYMRAPASFSRGTLNLVKTPISDPADLIATISNCCRYEQGYGTSMMRKILGVYHFEKGKDHWIRIKNLLKNYDQLGFSIDFIELVPLDIVNSQDYTEDWY